MLTNIINKQKLRKRSRDIYFCHRWQLLFDDTCINYACIACCTKITYAQRSLNYENT